MTTDRRDDDRDLAALRAQFDEADDLLDDAPLPLRSAAVLREAKRIADAKRAQPRRWPMALAASVATATFAMFLVNGRPVPEAPVTTAALDQPVAAAPAAGPAASTASVAPAASLPLAAPAASVASTSPTPFPSQRLETPAALRSQPPSDRLTQPVLSKPASPVSSPEPSVSFAVPAAPPPAPVRDAPDSPAARAMADATMPAGNAVAASSAPSASPPAPAAARMTMSAKAAAPGDAVDARSQAPADGRQRFDRREATDSTAAAAAGAPLAAPLDRPWEADPKAWHRHIDELRRAGRDAEAQRELDRLRARYPDDGKAPSPP